MWRALAFGISFAVLVGGCGGKVQGLTGEADSNTCDREPTIDVDQACLGSSDGSGPLLLKTKDTFGYHVGDAFRISGWFVGPTAEPDRRRETELTILPASPGASTFSAGSDTPTLTWQIAETTCEVNPDPGREDVIEEGRDCISDFIEQWHAVSGTMQCTRADDRMACQLHEVRFENGDYASGFTASGWVHAALPQDRVAPGP